MSQGHASNETLELYSLGRLREPELAIFEEHLLICAECQQRVEQEDELTRVTRRALATIRSERALEPPARPWSWPKLVWASGLALAALAVIVVLMVKPSPEDVQLIARRGADTTAAQARSGAPLNLTIDATDVPAMPAYEIEVVDANGTVVATKTVKRENGVLREGVPGLSAGTYWVRLYGGANRVLLREFSLVVR